MTSREQDTLNFIDDLGRHASVQSLDGAFARLIAGWGFDRWAVLPIYGPGRAVLSEVSTHYGLPPAKWAKRYREAGHYRSDALARAMQRSDRPVWWSRFEAEAPMSPEERNLFQEARECDVREGLTAPIALVDGSLWVCALTSPDAKPDRAVAFLAQGAIREYVLRVRELRRTDLGNGSLELTDAVREILILMGGGMNAKQAARALRKSPKTVYNQLGAARARLGVKSSSALVRMAAEHGWLDQSAHGS